MKPHPKLRKTVKWSGAAATVLLLIVWIASMRVTAWCFPTNRLLLELAEGRVGIAWSKGHVVLYDGFRHSGWRIETSWSNGWWFGYDTIGLPPELYIPLWSLIPIPLTAAATAWRLDTLARRRARAGGCPKCHYDRAGLLAEAVCPECGAAAPPTPDAPTTSAAPPTSVP